MRVVSVNVGLPKVHTWQRRFVRTAIFKDPVPGPVPIRKLNLDGDAQADLTVHGGPDKAVYAYPSDHYADWQGLLGRDLAPGAFGENLTTEGLIEDRVHVGDEFRVGTARLVVTQPRMPCYKLGLRFGDAGMVRTFLKVGRPGIYFAVVEEGVVAPGDPVERLAEGINRVTLIEMFALMFDKDPDPAAVRRLLEVPALAADWRQGFQARLDG
jgi:MOSC domain-containing protein YiiM